MNHFAIRLLTLLALTCLCPTALVAQTPQPQAVIEVGTGSNTHQFRWQGITGRLYVIQVSSDLANWVTAPVVELGAGDEIIWGFTPAGRAFVRLKYSVATNYTIGSGGDADGDGLTNGEEVVHYGTDPFLADTDADGIPDWDEVQAGLNPLLADSDGDATLDINEDSDGDGIINLHELANSSFIHEADTDGDARSDGDDWMEMVDSETASSVVYLPYDISDPMEDYPTPSEQVQFQADLTASAPSYDGVYTPSPLLHVPENAPDAGAVILAERVHEIYDLDDEWMQSGIYRKGTYRLRTGHAAAGTATGPNAHPAAQNATVPVLVHKASYAGYGFAPGAVPVEETFEIQHLSLSNGVVAITAAPPALPADLDDYNLPGEEGLTYHYIATGQTKPIKLVVDTNMNGTLEAFGGKGVQPARGTASSLADESADFLTRDGNGLQKDGDAGLILDINNNNSDATAGTSSAAQYDHLSEVFDGNPDYLEFGDKDEPPVGHTTGGAEIAISKSLHRALQPSAAFPAGQYYLRLASTNSNCLRVHRKLTASSFALLIDREEAAPPGTRYVENIQPAWFSLTGSYASIPIIIEGVRHGSDTLSLELVRTADNGVELSETVNVQVNVDQAPDSTTTNRDAIQLGEAATDGSTSTKHYVGAEFPTGALLASENTATITALRGIMKAEIPAFKPKGQIGWRPWLTHKGGRLRSGYANNAWTSTASFWIGLDGLDPQANNQAFTWVQTGLLLRQGPLENLPNAGGGHEPLLYFETGRRDPELYPAHAQVQKKFSETGGVFEDWLTHGLHFEFVLYERRGTQGNLISWQAVYHDLRTGKTGQYLSLSREMPQMPDPPANTAGIEALQNRARYRGLQARMEFHQSQSFLFGNTDYKASVEDVQFATERNPGGTNVEPSADAARWAWATGSGSNHAKFNWREATTTNNSATPNLTVNRGLRPQAVADVDTTGNLQSAGFWRLETITNSTTGRQKFLFWDTRTWGFARHN